jgi:hypothetical protein
MKKQILALTMMAGLMTAGLTSGCSLKFEQDPLASQPGPIRDGIPPNQKPEQPEPLKNGSVLVLGPSNYSFMEERTDNMQFRVNLLVSGYEAETIVVNLDSFPGASFDSKTGTFTWTPPKGTVLDGEFRELRLLIHSIATPANSDLPQLLGEKEVNLIVHRKMTIPEVRSVTTSPANATIREGAETNITVIVRDPDGGNSLQEGPSLLIFPPGASNIKSLAPQASVTLLSNDANNKEWTYRITIRLIDEEFTTSSDMGGFRIRAVNRFNRSSVETNFSAKVFTKLSNLNISWFEPAELTPGQENVIPFLVFDEKSEAMIDIQLATTLPAGADIRCQAARAGVLSCVFRWTPPGTAEEQNFSWNLNATGRNADRSDTQTTTRTFTLRAKVKALPPPAPTPTPEPTKSADQGALS